MSDAARWLGVFLLSLRAGMLAVGAAEMRASLGLDYSITVFDQEAGFSDYAMASVAAAPDGWLWYCSFGAVGRFDGAEFVDVSGPTNSPLAGIRPRTVFVDYRGRLWVGANSRIFCYETNVWRSFGVAQGVPGELIRSFAEDGRGGLWAASGTNIVRLAGERFEPLPGPKGMDEERCYLAVGRDGTVWCAGSLYLNRFDQGRWVTVLDPAQTRTNKIMGLLATRTGGLWVGFERDLKLWEGGDWVKVWRRPEGLVGDAVQMLEDSRGNLWVGGWRSGLVAYSPEGEARQATTREGLANNSVSDLTEDREGNIWLSSNGGGLVRLRPLAFRSYGRDAGLTQIANSVSEESPGRMLIGTHGDGVGRWEAGRISGLTFWPETNFLAGVWVHGVLRDRVGDTWAATYSPGLLRLHQGRWERIHNDQTGSRIILSLFEDREGRLWAGTSVGLAVREQGPFIVCGPTSGLPRMAVHGIGQDGAGDIWVCGPGDGLFRRHAGQFTPFYVPGIGTNAPFQTLAGGRDGSLWVGLSEGGLVRIQDGKCRVYGPDQGLPVMEVSALVEDDSGDLWLGGPKGVARLNRPSLEAATLRTQDRVQCQVFDSHDGLPGPVRSGFQPVCWKSSDGRIWFATLRGIAVADPKTILPKLPPPDMAITEVLVDGQPVAGWKTASRPLLLPPGIRTLDFHYSVVRLGTPERLRFQRRQRPDEAWEDAGKERQTHLHSVIPGRYRFEVRAADIDGVWGSSAMLAYDLPLFYWQTVWFRALILLSLGCAAGAAVAFALRSRHRRQAEAIARQAMFTQNLIKAQEAERHRIALELHDGVGQGLLVIANLAGLALRPGESAKAAQSELRKIATTSKEMVEDLRNLTRSLRPQVLDILGLTRALQTLLDQTARTGLQIKSELENLDALFPPPENINLYRIVQEAIANVLKHASATRVVVGLQTDATMARLSVEDNGCGFAVVETRAKAARDPAAGLLSLIHI